MAEWDERAEDSSSGREPVCYLIGAGDFGNGIPRLREGDYVIAADAGLSACFDRGIPVNLVIGDFDSLGKVPGEENFSGKQGDAEEHPVVRRLPVEKDDTDMRAAFMEGCRRGYRRFVIYGGAGGKRPSHTMANIQLLSEMAEKNCSGEMFGEDVYYTVVRNGDLHFREGCKGDLSVFSLTDRSEGVTISGLKYSLKDAALTNRFPLGVSNSFTGQAADISVRNGLLLIVWEDSRLSSPAPH